MKCERPNALCERNCEAKSSSSSPFPSAAHFSCCKRCLDGALPTNKIIAMPTHLRACNSFGRMPAQIGVCPLLIARVVSRTCVQYLATYQSKSSKKSRRIRAACVQLRKRRLQCTPKSRTRPQLSRPPKYIRNIFASFNRFDCIGLVFDRSIVIATADHPFGAATESDSISNARHTCVDAEPFSFRPFIIQTEIRKNDDKWRLSCFVCHCTVIVSVQWLRVCHWPRLTYTLVHRREVNVNFLFRVCGRVRHMCSLALAVSRLPFRGANAHAHSSTACASTSSCRLWNRIT